MGNVLNVNNDSSQSIVVTSEQSSISESNYLLMASLQLGALKTLGVLLTSSRYTDLLLVPRDTSDGEKTSTILNSGTGHDDLQVAKPALYLAYK